MPYDQSVQMHARLQALGVESRLLTVDGQGHGCDTEPDNPEAQAALAEVVEFLKGHCDGAQAADTLGQLMRDK